MTYPATNLQLEFDDATGEWSYKEAAYDYPNPTPPTWTGYTTPDPDFEFAPTEDDDDDDRDPCPEGYIYDEALKQCVPDPDYNPSRYAGDPTGGGGGEDTTDDNYVDFKKMDVNEMKQWGKKEGIIDRYGFYTGPKKSTMPDEAAFLYPPYSLIAKPLSQMGLDSQASRFVNEMRRKGGQIYNPHEQTNLAGNVYFPENPVPWGTYAMGTMYNNTKKTSGTIHTDPATIGTEQVTSVTMKTLDQIQNEIAEEKLKKAKADAIKAEAQANIIIDSVDTSGDTYTKIQPKDRSEGGGTGYTFTPKDPKPVKDKQYAHPAMGGKSVTIGPRAGVTAPKPSTKKSGYEARWEL